MVPTHAGLILVIIGDGGRPKVCVVEKDWENPETKVVSTERLLPKGHIEKGESAVETAYRELGEEAGIVVVTKSTYYVGNSTYKFGEENLCVHWYVPDPDRTVEILSERERMTDFVDPKDVTYLDQRLVAYTAVDSFMRKLRE